MGDRIDFFDKQSNYFGLYANPFENMCLAYQSLKKIKLEVFSNNIKAIDLYKKLNFRKIGTENMHNKSLVCMELEK